MFFFISMQCLVLGYKRTLLINIIAWEILFLIDGGLLTTSILLISKFLPQSGAENYLKLRIAKPQCETKRVSRKAAKSQSRDARPRGVSRQAAKPPSRDAGHSHRSACPFLSEQERNESKN